MCVCVSELKASILSRQREYKLAALKAKQSGNTEQAKQLYQVSKVNEFSIRLFCYFMINMFNSDHKVTYLQCFFVAIHILFMCTTIQKFGVCKIIYFDVN